MLTIERIQALASEIDGANPLYSFSQVNARGLLEAAAVEALIHKYKLKIDLSAKRWQVFSLRGKVSDWMPTLRDAMQDWCAKNGIAWPTSPNRIHGVTKQSDYADATNDGVL